MRGFSSVRVSFPVGKGSLESERVTCENRDTAGGGDNLIRARSAWEDKHYGFGFLTHREGQSERWEGESVLGLGKGNKAILRGEACPRYAHPRALLGRA